MYYVDVVRPAGRPERERASVNVKIVGKKKKKKVPPRFELGSWDSESQVLTVTPRNQAQ